jgi:hypothetical protein
MNEDVDEEAVDDDALAAEWESSVAAEDEDGDAAAGPAGTRVLDQDEIDSLLGFGDSDGPGGDIPGIQEMLDSSLVSYPMLEVVFDRLVRLMSTSLRNFTSGGRIELLLPFATLEPVHEVLLQMFLGEKFGRDSIWENHLARELWATDIEVEAVLDETDCSLHEVLNWRVGTYLPLSVMPETKVELRCGKLHVFNGFMGRKGDRVAVRIEDRLISDGKRD